jgi:ABC-type uncharacterized transport system permease subunit
VISTIMLNWIAIWVGKWLVELGGPMQGSEPDVPRSYDVRRLGQALADLGRAAAAPRGIFIALFGARRVPLSC